MNPFDMIKNIGQVKEELNKMKQEMLDIVVEGSSGAGMVTVQMNGHFEIISIKLEPICVDNRDIAMLQDLIIAACHDALEKVREQIQQKVGPYMQNIPLPI